MRYYEKFKKLNKDIYNLQTKIGVLQSDINIKVQTLHGLTTQIETLGDVYKKNNDEDIKALLNKKFDDLQEVKKFILVSKQEIDVIHNMISNKRDERVDLKIKLKSLSRRVKELRSIAIHCSNCGKLFIAKTKKHKNCKRNKCKKSRYAKDKLESGKSISKCFNEVKEMSVNDLLDSFGDLD